MRDTAGQWQRTTDVPAERTEPPGAGEGDKAPFAGTGIGFRGSAAKEGAPVADDPRGASVAATADALPTGGEPPSPVGKATSMMKRLGRARMSPSRRGAGKGSGAQVGS